MLGAAGFLLIVNVARIPVNLKVLQEPTFPLSDMLNFTSDCIRYLHRSVDSAGQISGGCSPFMCTTPNMRVAPSG